MIDWIKNNWKYIAGAVIILFIVWGLVGCGKSETPAVQEKPVTEEVKTTEKAVEEVEVEKVLPHLVDEKKLPLRADDDKEYKILRYEEMIPYLVEAIKEQQEEIDLLKANYDDLKYNRR